MTLIDKKQRQHQLSRAAFLPLRAYVGLAFLFSAWDIFFDGLPSWITTLKGITTKGIEGDRVWAIYKPILSGLVEPNVDVFAWAVFLCFIVLGIAIFAGAFTRLAALVALFLQVNFMLARGESFLGPHSDGLLIGMELALIIAAAGRFWGVDHFLHHRWPQPALY